MELDVGSFYEYLPGDLTGTHWTSNVQNEDGSQQSFVHAFLDRVLPQNRKAERDMTFKHITLDPKSHKITKSNKKKRKALTAKQKKALNLFKLNPDEIKYELYLPLHELWKEYMRDILHLHEVTPKNHGEAERKFMKADLHGCVILVAKSTCPSLLGLSGIVLQETKNMFRLVTKKDKLKTIPKKGTVFNICLEDYSFTIYGSNFMFKASERACRSFKLKPIIDLS